MKSEIAERIENINNGIIPEGYKKTKIGIVPVEWEETMFSSLFLILKNNTFSRAELNNEKGECFNVHYGDILTKFNTILDCDKDSLPFINQGIEIKTDYLIDGDIIIADTAEDNTAGKLIEIRNINGKRIVSGLHTIPCRPKKTLASKWLGYYMDSFAFHNQLIPIIIGIKVSSISKTEIQKTSLVLPPLPEQKKIAEILSTQDKLIKLKQKLIDRKKQQKKWLMQKMLTGKKRLKGFSEEWERVKLRDICNTFSGGTPNRSHPEYFNGNIKWIKSGELNNNYILDTEESITELGLNKSSAKMVDKDTLLIAMYGATAGVIAFTKIKAAINQAILALIPKKDLNTFFLKNSIENQIQIAISKLTQGGQPNFNASIIGSFEILFPSISEQTAIAEILSQQDKEIELLEKELELQKQKKKALMQLLLTGKVRVKP